MLAMLLSVALQAGSPVAETGWAEVGRFDDNETIYLQTDNLERQGTVSRAWSWSRFDTPQEGGVTSTFFRNDYDCAARTYSFVAYRKVNASGEIVDEGTIAPAERTTRPINPGSNADRELRLVCR